MNTDKTETWSSSNILDTSLGAGGDYFFVKKIVQIGALRVPF